MLSAGLHQRSQFLFEDRYLGGAAGKGIHNRASHVELHGRKRKNAQGLHERLVVFDGETGPDDWNVFIVFRSHGHFLKFGFQTLAGAAPRGKDFENHQFVFGRFQQGGVLFRISQVVDTVLSEFGHVGITTTSSSSGIINLAGLRFDFGSRCRR